jgi:hypothetical protein
MLQVRVVIPFFLFGSALNGMLAWQSPGQNKWKDLQGGDVVSWIGKPSGARSPMLWAGRLDLGSPATENKPRDSLTRDRRAWKCAMLCASVGG